MGHGKDVSDYSESERDSDVTNRRFPPQGYKPGRTEAYLDRESGRHNADCEQSAKLSDRAKCQARCKATAEYGGELNFMSGSQR